MIQLQLHRLWHFAGHRPAIAVAVLAAMFAVQSVVAYGRLMLY